jgi:glycosyltransferase involved in cell wall biosynthesis
MRIAQVAPLNESVPPKLYGGTERLVSWLTEELVGLGHEVTLFASGDSKTSARLVPGCSESLRLNQNCVDRLAHHLLMIERVFAEKSNFDVIHFHIEYLHFSLIRREPMPHISTLHGRLDIPDLSPLYNEFRDLPLVSVSDAQRAPLPWANWQATVHHGLPEFSYQLGKGDGGYLAFLGRISPEKGLDAAIEIAKRSGVRLKIAAKIDAVDLEYFHSTIEPLLDHPLIEFIGEINDSEKNDFLGKALALLFPICWPEPFGLVMIEAMACGTPIIAYRHGSVPEVVEHGVNGFIVPDIASAVQAVEKTGTLSRRRCRNCFLARFSAARMAQDYLAIYERQMRMNRAMITVPDGVLNWTKLRSQSRSSTT